MKISVIIPVYRVEEYLEKCVRSVMTQTFSDLEIILVDDGSPDNCPQICDDLAASDNRIRVIHKKNGGLSSARNSGLDIATGDYVYFIDSDDYIAPSTLSTMVSYFKSDDIDIVIAGVQPFYISDDKPAVFDAMVQYFSGFDTIKKLTSHQILKTSAVAWGKLYKKSIIDKYNLRFDNGLINEDESWNWYYNTKIRRGVVIPNRFYNYLIRGDSIVGQKQSGDKNSGDILYIIENTYNHLLKYNLLGQYKRRFYGWAQHLICATQQRALASKNIELLNKCEHLGRKYGTVQYSWAEWIFSVKHTWDRKQKVLCIFGIKIRI